MFLRFILAAVIAALALGSQSCGSSKRAGGVVVVQGETAPPVAKRPGPPPHAPAHGYRHQHPDGVDLVYDAPRGVYVVQRHSKCYWRDGHYYRQKGTRWEMSGSIRGPWGWVGVHTVPSSLTAEYTKSKKNKKH
jgi:hypothetical protein